MTKTYLNCVPVTIQSNSNGQLQGMSSVYPVQRDGSVDFVVADSSRVVVTLDSPTCLTQSGPFYLDGSNPSTAATGPISVRADARRGVYPFTVAPETSPGSGVYKKPGDFEAKQGELEVATDPEEEDEEKGKGKGKRG